MGTVENPEEEPDSSTDGNNPARPAPRHLPVGGPRGGGTLEDAPAHEGLRTRIALVEEATGVPDAPAHPIPGAAAGRVSLGAKYRILGEIAAGGMGIILKCRDEDVGRDVAVKVLHEHYRDDPEMLERFIEEAQINGQLQHPGIVPVYDLGMRRERQQCFFTMKLIKGRTLGNLLQERTGVQTDRQYFLRVFLQVCQTMAYAHARGVIHRDLKPSNVMVGSFGEVLIVDWGLAKILPREAGSGGGPAARPRSTDSVISTLRSRSGLGQSLAGSVIGTPAYMPPEQASGDIERLEASADVFSLGAILCEILTGTPPYASEDPQAVLKLAAAGTLEDAMERLEGCGAEPELIELTRECLRTDPRLRPRTGSDLAERIDDYLSGVQARAQQARIVAAEERVKASAARRAQRLTTGLALSILCIVLLGSVAYLWIEGERAAQVSRASQGINEALLEATRIRGQDPEPGTEALARALAVLQSAETLVGTHGLPEDLCARVAALGSRLRQEESEAQERAERVVRDHRMRLRLDEIAIPPDSELGLTGFEAREAQRKDTALARAFAEYGLDLQRLSTGEALRGIRESAIRTELAVALETWALERQYLQQMAMARGGGPRADPGSWRYLMKLARDADDDPLRTKLRTLVLEERLDEETLESLARSVEPTETPPLTLTLLGRSFMRLARIESGISLLRRAQRTYPADFGINLQLGGMLEAKRPPVWTDAIRFYSAALAVRPRSLVALHRLGSALEGSGDGEGALGVFDEAIRLDPEQSDWHIHRRRILQNLEGGIDEAIAASRRALELDPGNASEHRALALLYRQKGRFADAAHAYRHSFDLGGLTWVKWRALGDADRYTAARVAALAGSGRSDQPLVAGEAQALRAQALEWLIEELRFKRLALVGRPAQVRARIRSDLAGWVSDDAFRAVREAEALPGLPPAEARAWENLWRRVRLVLAQLEANPAAPARPQNQWPSRDSTVDGPSLELRTGAFESESPLSTHAFTLWQLRTSDGDYALNPVYSALRDDSLGSLVLPPGLLLPRRSYCWRAAHSSESGSISEFSEETTFRTGDLPWKPRPIDLSRHFNRDLIADAPGTATDSIDYGEGFLVAEGFDGRRTDATGVRGVPRDRVIGVHRLGDYRKPNAIQFTRESREAIRIEVPRARYVAFRALVAGGNGGSRVPVTIEHADGSLEAHELVCDDWFEDLPPNPYGPLADGLWPVHNGMDRLFAGSFEDVNDATILETIIHPRADADVVAITLEPDRGAFEVPFTRFNLFAITGMVPR